MYRIYPTLLNSFAYHEAQTLDSQGNILVNTQEMLDRINRVRKPTTQAQQRGIDFEKAVEQVKMKMILRKESSKKQDYYYPKNTKRNFI